MVYTNGLIVSRSAFPTFAVVHRGNVVEDVVAHALTIADRFDDLAAQVERMEQRRLLEDEQLRFDERALALRYPDPGPAGMAASQLLHCRRPEDARDELFSTLNKVEENLLRDGLIRRSASGRLGRTRRITSIQVDIPRSGTWLQKSPRLECRAGERRDRRSLPYLGPANLTPDRAPFRGFGFAVPPGCNGHGAKD